MLLTSIIISSGIAAVAQMPHRTPEAIAENARWVVHSATWGYLTELNSAAKTPVASAVSFSDGEAGNSTGRLFFYLMGSAGHAERLASLTISEAALNTTCGDRDPEDPRCAKITLSGRMKLSSGSSASLGKRVLFARHPQMRAWPLGHGFEVHELVLSNIWMIDFYGGGGDVKVAAFLAAKAKHNVPAWPPMHGYYGRHPHEGPNHQEHHQGEHSAWYPHDKHWHGDHHEVVEGLHNGKYHHAEGSRWKSHSEHDRAVNITLDVQEPPPWNHTAARARWLVYHSTWGSVGTTSVSLQGAPWGGMRSVADGMGKNSTGIPVLYIPSPDPLAKNLGKDNHATLSFSEAALTERFSTKGICSGMDPEDPTCAQITFSGQLLALSKPSDIKQAELNLGQHHPFAPWLAKGGDHTGGKYYSMDIDKIMFLDYYGGPAELRIADYLAASPPNYLSQKGDLYV